MYYPALTQKGVADLIGLDQEANKLFHVRRHHLIETVKKAGFLDIRVQYPSDMKSLHHMLDSDTQWCEPDELYIPYDTYTRDYGDPKTNGRGHAIEKNPKGVLCVVVVESDVMRKKKSVTDKVRMHTVLDDGANKLEDNQIDLKWQAMRRVTLFDGSGVDSSVDLPDSSKGTSLADLLGWDASGTASSSNTAVDLRPNVERTDSAPARKGGSDSEDDTVHPLMQLCFNSAAASTPPRTRARLPQQPQQQQLQQQQPQPQQQQQQQEPSSGSGKRKSNAPAEGEPKKKAGRPARDPVDEAAKSIKQFSMVPDDNDDPAYQLWFGDHRKNQERFLTRVKSALDSYLKTVTDESRVAEHMSTRKQLECVIQIVLNFNKLSGGSCKAFPKALTETRKYMTAAPTCILDLPVPVRRLELEGILETATHSPPEEFWPHVALDNLRGAGIQNTETRQKTFIADAIAERTQAKCITDVSTDLIAFFTPVAGDAPTTSLPAPLSSEVFAAFLVVIPCDVQK